MSRGEEGFGTLEALTAFLILSMMMAGIVQLVSGSSRLLRAADRANNDLQQFHQGRVELRTAADREQGRQTGIKAVPLPNESRDSLSIDLLIISDGIDRDTTSFFSFRARRATSSDDR